MDKQTFEKEILSALPIGGATAYYNRWHQRRKEVIRTAALSIKTRSIDYHLLNAISVEGIPHSVEKIVPGFNEHFRQYASLQTQLLHDLTKINKVVSKEITPFQDWLSNL